jgi:tetratricopeptide (TPR) repeat protein
MYLDDYDPNREEIIERGTGDQAVAVEDSSASSEAADTHASSDLHDGHTARERNVVRKSAATDLNPDPKIPSRINGARSTGRQLGTRWWLLAAGSALLLTILTIAGVYLLTKKPSTIDQLVILTVPSGAEINLDSKGYGHSPVKLEQLAIGTYTLTITKEGFEPIVQEVNIVESIPPLEFRLKPIPPSDSVGLPPEEAIKRYKVQAEEAFARGNYMLGYEGTALNYADLILSLDNSNQFASEMRERIRKTEHQIARESIARGDLGQAQEIYSFLIENYTSPPDEEARAAAAKLENQLALRRGEVQALVRKAEEALQAGNLIDPLRTSAYYYSKQALAIDRQNAQARSVREQVKKRRAEMSEQAFARGEVDTAIKQMEQTIQLFPEDKQLRERLREFVAGLNTEAAKVIDPNTRREQGLYKYRHDDFDEAIPDLEAAILNGRGTPEVIFALARSCMKIGQLDKAALYFRKVPPSGDDLYRSSIAALGDIAREHGDAATALDRYKEARQLGGSTLYSIATLDDKIEKIEKKQREKDAEPVPLTIRAKHLHGGVFGGSCGGTISINSTGVRYDGSEHVFSSNLVGVGVRMTKDELIVKFQDKSEKFKAARADAERFSETLSRFQQAYSPINK